MGIYVSAAAAVPPPSAATTVCYRAVVTAALAETGITCSEGKAAATTQ